jgi:hypothetical protein
VPKVPGVPKVSKVIRYGIMLKPPNGGFRGLPQAVFLYLLTAKDVNKTARKASDPISLPIS